MMVINPLRVRPFFVPYYRLVFNMSSPIQTRRLHSYEEAIQALNSLQTNAAVLKQVSSSTFDIPNSYCVGYLVTKATIF